MLYYTGLLLGVAFLVDESLANSKLFALLLDDSREVMLAEMFVRALVELLLVVHFDCSPLVFISGLFGTRLNAPKDLHEGLTAKFASAHVLIGLLGLHEYLLVALASLAVISVERH